MQAANYIKPTISALLAGILLGIGLVISEMVNPQKVLGFLDILGAWDANLALVMASAVGVTIIAFRFILKRKTPIVSPSFHLTNQQSLDVRLLTGAVLFGIGWGLAGYCPGPGIINVIINTSEAMIFLPAMLIGGWIGNQFRAA